MAALPDSVLQAIPFFDYALAGAAGIPIDLNDAKEDKEILTYTESLVLS